MAKIEMDIINPHCAGIDIGSRSHFVAIGQGQNDVQQFGVYADDLVNICNHLKQHGITHVAMESTGSYWQTLFNALQEAGFEVLLAGGSQTKNVRAGRPVPAQNRCH